MRMDAGYKYEVALSFAGEDRAYAEELATALRSRGVEVFYDRFSEDELWGENLYTYLSDLYQNRAKYVVMFLSKHYASKLWTNHERESAQARAFRENGAYILPIRLDATSIPGILSTVGYLEWPPKDAQEIAELVVRKLGRQPSETLAGTPQVQPRYTCKCKSMVHALAISPDDTIVAACDGVLRRWYVETGKKLRELSPGYGRCLAFSHDGAFLLSDANETVLIWDTKSWEVCGSLIGERSLFHETIQYGEQITHHVTEKETTNAHGAGIYDIRFSPDRRFAATASSDHTIKLWDIETWRESGRIDGHTGPVDCVAISPTSDVILSTSSWDKTARLWSVPTKREIHLFGPFSSGPTWGTFLPDGRNFITHHDRKLSIWNTETFSEERTISCIPAVEKFAVSPDGRLLFAAAWTGLIEVIDLLEEERLQLIKAHADPVFNITVSSDGKTLVSCSRNCEVKVWTVA